MTSPSLRPAGSGLSLVPPLGARSVPSSALSFTTSPLAAVMSVRMVLDNEEDTKAIAENRIIRTARTQVHERKRLMVGLVWLSHDALRLSAVTGCMSAASVVSAASRLAFTVLSAPVLVAPLARKTVVRVVSSTFLPISAAYVSRHMASFTAPSKLGVGSGV